MIDVAKDELIPFAEVAERFKVTMQTVHSWSCQGLEAVKMGRKWYTTAAALNGFAGRNEPERKSRQAEATKRMAAEAIAELKTFGITCEGPRPKRSRRLAPGR